MSEITNPQATELEFDLDRAASTILNWACNGDVEEALRITRQTLTALSEGSTTGWTQAMRQLDQIIGWLKGYRAGVAGVTERH